LRYVRRKLNGPPERDRMSIAYDGPADITLGQLTAQGALTTFAPTIGMPIRLREDEPLGMATVHLNGRMNGPDNPSYVIVQIPGGSTLAGEVVEDVRGQNSGWLYFKVQTNTVI
jgi:hypothetical protein